MAGFGISKDDVGNVMLSEHLTIRLSSESGIGSITPAFKRLRLSLLRNLHDPDRCEIKILPEATIQTPEEQERPSSKLELQRQKSTSPMA